MTIGNILFLSPWMGLLLLIPLIIHIIKRSNKSINNNPIIFHPNAAHIARIYQTRNLKKSFPLKLLLLSLAWIMLTIASMQPNITQHNSAIDNDGHDLMLAIDISGSMKALDFATKNNLINRLDVTKQVVRDFIKKRSGDRIGLILFGETAYMETPLTIDHTTLISSLNSAEIGIVGGGTAIGDASALAISKLKDKKIKSRMIILLTDGENNTGKISPITAANLAKKYDIPIYTIGVGTTGIVPYPTSNGTIIETQMYLDSKTLTKISDITNGKYYNATDKESFQKIYQEIDKLITTKQKTNIFVKYSPLYHYFIFAALIFLLIFFSQILGIINFSYLKKQEC